MKIASIKITLFIFFSFTYSQNQSNMYFSGEMNSWGASSMTMNDLGIDTWQVTIQSDGDDGSSEFKLRNSNANYDQNWSRGDAITLGSKTTFYNPNGGNSRFSETNGKYYTFIIKDVANSSNSEGYIFEFSQTPVSISSVSSSGNALSSTVKAITIGLSGTPDNNERVYVRYTTDNWSSSAIIEGDPSSNSININIPGQSAGTTVKYYVFTSIAGISNADADLAAISFANNSGNNYSYYVESGVGAISGNSGFRMLSSPVSGQILGNLLTNLWTQGMTGADNPNGTSNVWILDVAGQSWTALSDISSSGTSLSAGQGFLIYVFEDTDFDGTGDLPINISVSGTENSSNATYGSIGDGDWGIAGNPYLSTIDWDLISKTNIASTVYVWDDGTSAYKSWNGSAGGLTDGLIAPYQGFWVQASGGTGSITISTSNKATASGTLYRAFDAQESGSVVFDVSSSDFSDQTFMSFQSEGEVGLDNADGYKLLPLSPTNRVVAISYVSDTGLDINNLPYDYEENIQIPLDIMQLQLDGTDFITQEEEITLSWDISNLPEHISLTLIDQITNIETDMGLLSSMSFNAEPKGSFSTNYNGPIGTYPIVGEPRFSLVVSYNSLGSGENIKILPSELVLHSAYPNPFNPSTTISFDLPKTGQVSLAIYDVKGALVEQLLKESKIAGYYHYRWTPNKKLASGLYFFELRTINKTRHQKITYIK